MAKMYMNQFDTSQRYTVQEGKNGLWKLCKHNGRGDWVPFVKGQFPYDEAVKLLDKWAVAYWWKEVEK